jgi:uncharacterized protein YbjT (DUF2867 family)
MQQRMRIAVAGATGRAGRHVAETLWHQGHEVIPIARSVGVDLISGKGLAEALDGVDVVVDAATAPSPEQEPATEFFTAAARNLQEFGRRAGVRRIVVVSIIGVDRSAGGYGVAKQAHERASLEGPVPVRILRAAQFHELVPQLIEWGRENGVAQVPRMRTQLVAARTVGMALAVLATNPGPENTEIPEIAGPREENLAEMARLYASTRGVQVEIEEASNPDDPDSPMYESGGLLPGPNAAVAGPTFEQWLMGVGG